MKTPTTALIITPAQIKTQDEIFDKTVNIEEKREETAGNEAVGAANESVYHADVLSMVQEVVFGVGFALLLPIFFGLDGVLYSMPVSDGSPFLSRLRLLSTPIECWANRRRCKAVGEKTGVTWAGRNFLPALQAPPVFCAIIGYLIRFTLLPLTM